MFEDGWLSSATKIPSPNFNQRPEASEINLLVIHNISLPPFQFNGQFVEDFFLGKLNSVEHPYFNTIKELEVSSHFYIRRDGSVIQFVSTLDRAWHAGVSEFEGKSNCNDYSIGIELAGADNIPYTRNQYHSIASLTKRIQSEYPAITQNRIAGHSDIAPERKTDPGLSFDWQRYFELLRHDSFTSDH